MRDAIATSDAEPAQRGRQSAPPRASSSAYVNSPALAALRERDQGRVRPRPLRDLVIDGVVRQVRPAADEPAERRRLHARTTRSQRRNHGSSAAARAQKPSGSAIASARTLRTGDVAGTASEGPSRSFESTMVSSLWSVRTGPGALEAAQRGGRPRYAADPAIPTGIGAKGGRSVGSWSSR